VHPGTVRFASYSCALGHWTSRFLGVVG